MRATTDLDPVRPDIPIFDPHHHFRDGATPYLAPELDRDIAPLPVVGTFFIECSFRRAPGGPPELRSIAETEAVVRIDAEARAKRPRPYLGIVGFADLSLGDRISGIIEKHIEAAQGRLVGIRNVSAWDRSEALKHRRADPPEHLLSRPAFREGFAQLARRGLTFDAWLYHTQIGELVELARVFPETTIVLDHMAGPIRSGPYARREREVFQAWKTGLQDLAECPNVFVKIGGLGMRALGFDIFDRASPAGSEELAALWRPQVETCIDIFGPRRAMFESNFPVDAEACDYATLWTAFRRLAASYSPSEQAALLGETACRAYRVPTSIARRFGEGSDPIS
jgi:predicted TIM-barrel fold metal-dependent hydrolase